MLSIQAQAQDASSLRARHDQLKERLRDNSFQRPLYLESRDDGRSATGDVYAVIEQPFAVLSSTLQGAQNWCDILILHLNVKGCRTWSDRSGDIVSLNVGRKHDQPIEAAHRLDFKRSVVAARPDYLQVTLDAAKGPLGTSDYLILLEVAPLDRSHAFLHFSYAYSYGLASRVAVNGYLATAGRDKVGFTVIGKKPDGAPVYTGKIRGVVERNAMRYYLAIEAYVDALSAPHEEQVERRLQSWHTAVERYPLQLRELNRSEYLAMKRNEIQRQQRHETTQRR